MAGLKKHKHYSIFGILLLIHITFGSKLNVPRVLLPVFNDISTSFVLEATEGGCYKWSTTRSDIIKITPLDEDVERRCSMKVQVSTVTKEQSRNIAVILAEDVMSKQMLRCDVIVDAIHSLSITTTTKELFMEEAPEVFEVVAHDDQGNEFSSLEGVEFEWSIIATGAYKDSVLKYIKYKDSPYETPPSVVNMENNDKKGHMILLEGVKSGSAKVSVRLPHSEYRHVEACEVQLVVVANLLIAPAEVYVMPGDAVPFKIFFINNGRMEEIDFPSSQYYIDAEDASIAVSIALTGLVTAKAVGKTRIVLKDRHLGKDDPILKLPAATMHVVEPEYILLSVLPHRNWAVMVGEHHDIVAEVYSSTNHKLFLGDNVKCALEIAPEFYILDKTLNGTWVTGYGVKTSLVTVSAKLHGTTETSRNSILETKGELLVYPRITIAPSEIILPWDPLTRPKYDIDLEAKGGDGRFLWSSSDNSIGVVSQSGKVHTHSNGFFEVSAAMLRNHYNRATAKFIIVPPSRLEIVEFIMEAEVGQPIYLHVALYAERAGTDGQTLEIPFTKCQNLPFQIKQNDVKFKQNKTSVLPPVGISCGNIAMVGLEVGSSKISITYFHEGRALEDSVSITAYQRLILLEPKEDVVLAVGSSINLVYIGGPRPIPGRSAEHNRVVLSQDESIVEAIDITSSHTIPGETFTVVQVLCKRLGETDIKLMISNTPLSSNCKSQTGMILTRVTCGKPRKIQALPLLKISNVDSCPMDLSSGNIVVQSSKEINIEVTVTDECGNRFLNFSSLVLDWSLSPAGHGSLLRGSLLPQNVTVGTVAVADRSLQVFSPSVANGTVQIHANIIGYNGKILKHYGINPEYPPFLSPEERHEQIDLSTELTLLLVEDTVISPDKITIFNHPGNRKVLKVSQGSGFFELRLSSEDIADVRYLEASREIEIIPWHSGDLTIQLADLCLVAKPPTVKVEVVSIGILRVDMVDKVELGKCIKAVVRLYDENDNLMYIPDPAMVDMRASFDEPIANVQLGEVDKANPWPVGEIHFVVTGLEAGDTKLTFTVSGSTEDVSSAPMDLQIFLPMRLHPRNGSILLNSNFQFNVRGGPHPDVVIEYTPANPKLIAINSNGIITGKALGTTKILAQAIGTHPTSGNRVVYSEDTVELKVVELAGIKLKIPLSRFKAGAVVPLWIVGVPDDTSPLILGSIENPPLQCSWEVEDPQLIDLNSAFHRVGISYDRFNLITVQAFGLKPGKTKINVNVTVSGYTANRPSVETVRYSASVDVEVIQAILSVVPKYVAGRSLFMAPFSSLPLKNNMDNSAVSFKYILPERHAMSTDLVTNKSLLTEKLITVSSEGVLQSYGSLGHSYMVVLATEESGMKQKLAYTIEVKKIQYMSLRIDASWRAHADTTVKAVPLGAIFNIRGIYHDSLGNRLHAGPSKLKARVSRCDVIKLVDRNDYASIEVQAIMPGHSMIKIWADGIDKTAVYLKVFVEKSVRPKLDHATAGDILCLWTPLVSRMNLPGMWYSSDSSLIEVNTDVDMAIVKNKEGIAVMTHTLHPAASLDIHVLPVSIIELLPPANVMLTNSYLEQVVRIPIVLQSVKSMGFKTNNVIQGWRCRTDIRKLVKTKCFRCFASFSNATNFKLEEIFNITESIVPDSGSYSCKFTSLGKVSKEMSVITSDVNLWVTTNDGELSSEILVLKFRPAFYAPKEVYLDEYSQSATFEVVGLNDVLMKLKVKAADEEILYVDRGGFTTPNMLTFTVQLIDYHWRLAGLQDAMSIRIISKMTKQDHIVMVKVVGDANQVCGVRKSPVMAMLSSYKHLIAMLFAMLLIFFLTFYFYSNYMQPVVNVNVNRPYGFGSSSPLNCSTGTSFTRSSNLSSSTPTSSSSNPCSHKVNCTCCAANRDPVYGDPTSFYNSPGLRRNPRIM